MSGDGGGASRTTDPASGTSSATDVSLREFFGMRLDALDRHMTHELDALRREASVANQTAEKAIEVAAQEAKDRLQAHNGLIEQNRQREELNRQAQEKAAGTFATRESVDGLEKHLAEKIGRVEKFQFMLTGGILLLSFIGIANLVKVWTG